MWRAHGWQLLTHGGYVTYIHHDTSGLITVIFPWSGAKIWGYFYVKKDHIPETRKKLFKIFDLLGPDSELDKEDAIGLGTIVIEERDIL